MLEFVYIIIAILFILYSFKALKEDKLERIEMRKRLMEDVEIIPNYSIEKQEIQNFKSLLILEKILSIKVYQINEPFYDLKSKNQYIIDGGIEFLMPKGYFCIGFSTNFEHFIFSSESFKKIYSNNNEIELDSKEIPEVYNLINKKIIDVHFKIKEFDESIDYTMITKKISKPIEIKLTFENQKTLHISLINLQLGKKLIPENFTYSLEKEILISFNKTEIKM